MLRNMPVVTAGKSSETITAEAAVVLAAAAYLGLATKVICSGDRLFNSGDAGNLSLGISVFQCGAQSRRDFGEFHNCSIS